MRRIAAAILFLLAPFNAPAVTLTVLHTSDLHGRVHPVDALADEDLGEGLARVAAAVKVIRSEGNPVLLLDSGDTIQGAPEQALILASPGGAAAEDPIVRAMNLAGYDAMAVGNHEFDFGRGRLETSRKQARFPWLCANALAREDKPAFLPYVVQEIGGVRVGILGLVTNAVASWVSPELLDGVRFTDPVAAARRLVPVLRGKERCDLVVVVTHQGFERDPAAGGDAGAAGENRANAIARIPGIDLLLTGHGHQVVSPHKIGETWASQPGRWGNTVTRFDVTLEKAGDAWKVSEVRGRNLPMKRVLPDPDIVASVAAAHAESMRVLAATAAELLDPVSARRARTQDSALLDWIHSVQLRESGAEISFCSLLPKAAPDWKAGPLTVRQIWQIYPYENSLVTLRATGREIRAALERAASCFADHGERLRNCDSLEGAEYVLDPSRPRGKRVVSLTRGGREIGNQEVLTVALNSYRASGGGGYGMWKRAERLKETGSIRAMLIADARAKRRLKLEPSGNWKLAGTK